MAGERTPNRNQISYTELQNPLFIHPSDGPNSIAVSEKLMGAKNYRSWRRSMEIHLSTKRKLVFVQGTLPRPTDDPVKGDQWDSCNNLVISWIMNSVCESISRSVLYVESAREIWLQLEKRFSLSNGSRKYCLNKDVYTIRQNGGFVSDYYTQIKGIWEELDSMIDLPKVSVANEEIANFLCAFGRMQEEQKLFQFLNGLDEVYKAQRSQILIMNPLPSVETACSILQQEELQREVLADDHFVHESSALYGKSVEPVAGSGAETRCSHYGNKGHVKDKCWQIIGYPRGHPRSKKFPQAKTSKDTARVPKGKTVAHVESASFKSTEGGLSLTSQQVEQLLKLLPQSGRASTEAEEDELEQSFAGNVYCSCASTKTSEWILDTGATDHMTPECKNLMEVQACVDSLHINLPDGSSASITHKGQVYLENGLVLKNTLCVPSFRFNLLSISKLAADNNCVVLF